MIFSSKIHSKLERLERTQLSDDFLWFQKINDQSALQPLSANIFEDVAEGFLQWITSEGKKLGKTPTYLNGKNRLTNSPVSLASLLSGHKNQPDSQEIMQIVVLGEIVVRNSGI